MTGDHPSVAASARIESGATVGDGTRIWELATIRTGAIVGDDCVIGRGAFIDAGVVLGQRCKIQNGAALYAPAVLESGVFIGPAVVLTNDRFPRAVSPSGDLKRSDDWERTGVYVESGASIGAGSVVIGGLRIGQWAMVAAGSTVTRDVQQFALVAGVPARRIGWVGPAGRRLERHDTLWRCPDTGQKFNEVRGRLEIV